MRKRIGLLCFLVGLSNALMAQSVEHVVWDRTPIRITLPLNEERLIRFPLAVNIVDSELDASTSVMKAQDIVYLNAHKPFKNKRLVVQLMPEGEAIILSLSSSAESSNATPIKVVMADNDVPNTTVDAAPNDSVSASEDSPQNTTTSERSQINPVSLTRFAIQSLYAPARLLVTPEGVGRTPMRTNRNITLVLGASVTATPLISWKGEDVYVTAIELKNQLNKALIVKPHMLLGDWQTVAFYPTNTLGARGNHDVTTVFVTSSKPFGEALDDNREFVR